MLAMQVVAKLATMMWTSSLIIALSRPVFFPRLGMPMAFRPTPLRARAGVQVSRHSCCCGQARETVRRCETEPAERTRSLTACTGSKHVDLPVIAKFRAFRGTRKLLGKFQCVGLSGRATISPRPGERRHNLLG